MERLRHGYTNRTRLTNGRVEKIYEGPRQWANTRRELACLTQLGDQLPLAEVVEHDLAIPQLTLSFVPGRHGQDLLGDGYAEQVLRLVGHTLVALQRFAPDTVRDLEGDGSVIVHGDFGPQNTLFDLDADRVTGVLDWESAHIGSPIEDLAWSEWIVRKHHPDAIDALDHLFAARATTATVVRTSSRNGPPNP